MFQKELRYQIVEHLLLVIREYLEKNCHLILLYVELMRKELRQEVEDIDKDVVEFWILLKKVARNPPIKSLAKKGIKYALGIYHNLTK